MRLGSGLDGGAHAASRARSGGPLGRIRSHAPGSRRPMPTASPVSFTFAREFPRAGRFRRHARARVWFG